MRQKWPLFFGIAFLLIAIFLRIWQLTTIVYMPFFVLGVSLKIYYIIGMIRKGQYKPGREVLLLIVGLILFFTGLVVKNNFAGEPYLYLVIPGLILKFVFVLFFILKLRSKIMLDNQQIKN